MVFDAPLLTVNFEKRLEQIKTRLAKCDDKIVKLHKHEKCTSQEHLDKELKRVLDIQGEGLMIKDPDCPYIGKRTKKLLKIKVF